MKRKFFTHKHYIETLLKLRTEGFELITVRDYFHRKNEKKKFIVLRHDVDRLPTQAVRIATLEHAHGILSSYYFRSSKDGRFQENAIKIISDMGHEVGYHYENLSQFNGDMDAAIKQFQRNIDRFRLKYKCETVCAHGKPLSRHNNFLQLVGRDLTAFKIIGDATHSLADDKLAYFTDTGGAWNIEKTFNFRDYVHAPSMGIKDITPSEIEEFVKFLHSFDGAVYINTHPERWAHNGLFLLRTLFTDFLINIAKIILKTMRSK